MKNPRKKQFQKNTIFVAVVILPSTCYITKIYMKYCIVKTIENTNMMIIEMSRQLKDIQVIDKKEV